MPRPEPYVGMTGVASTGQALSVASLINVRSDALRHRRLMIGVLVSGKTLAGAPGGSVLYPTIEVAAEIANLLYDYQPARVAMFVHFNTRDSAPLHEQLEELVRRVPRLRGVQLNMPDPSPSDLQVFKAFHPEIEVVLQARHETLAEVHEFVAARRGLADHVLIDASLGRGVPLDPEIGLGLRTYGPKWHWWEMSYGVAGKLGPEAGPTLQRFAEALGQGVQTCSFDAESQLREPAAVQGGERGPLKWQRCLGWLTTLGSGLALRDV